MKNSPFNAEAIKRLKYWITEREAIRAAKAAGRGPLLWTKDPILQKFRFCNVHRNHDRVTEWIHLNWLAPHAGDPDLWFAMVVARLVNWPDTLATLAPAVFNLMKRNKKGPEHDVHWDPSLFVHYMHARKADGHKVFGGAYIVSTNGRKMDKAEYLAAQVLTPLWENRARIRPEPGDTLADLHASLLNYDGMGSFMAGQVVADIKYDPDGPLHYASDFCGFAVPGPGSLRGMCRVLWGDIDPDDYTLSERNWRLAFHDLWPVMDNWMKGGITGQDLQNCLCEYDKYERVRLGQGTPRALYKSHGA